MTGDRATAATSVGTPPVQTTPAGTAPAARNPGSRRRGGGVLAIVAIALLAAVLLSSRLAAGPPGAEVRAGQLRISNASVPRPVSNDVAAAYLVVRYDGDSPDVLRGVSSDAAQEVTVMAEDAAGTMRGGGQLVVPAHGTVALRPGQRHLMLASPRPGLREGSTVRITLVFARAGAVTVSVPVTAAGSSGAGGTPAGSTG